MCRGQAWWGIVVCGSAPITQSSLTHTLSLLAFIATLALSTQGGERRSLELIHYLDALPGPPNNVCPLTVARGPRVLYAARGLGRRRSSRYIRDGQVEESGMKSAQKMRLVDRMRNRPALVADVIVVVLVVVVAGLYSRA